MYSSFFFCWLIIYVEAKTLELKVTRLDRISLRPAGSVVNVFIINMFEKQPDYFFYLRIKLGPGAKPGIFV